MYCFNANYQWWSQLKGRFFTIKDICNSFFLFILDRTNKIACNLSISYDQLTNIQQKNYILLIYLFISISATDLCLSQTSFVFRRANRKVCKTFKNEYEKLRENCKKNTYWIRAKFAYMVMFFFSPITKVKPTPNAPDREF